jgi:hypothetical protein
MSSASQTPALPVMWSLIILVNKRADWNVPVSYIKYVTLEINVHISVSTFILYYCNKMTLKTAWFFIYKLWSLKQVWIKKLSIIVIFIVEINCQEAQIQAIILSNNFRELLFVIFHFILVTTMYVNSLYLWQKYIKWLTLKNIFVSF